MSLFQSRRWPHGIRLQVLCWYTAVFTFVLLLAGAVCYYYFENALEDSVNSSLQVQANQIADEITVGKDTITIHDATGILSELNTDQPLRTPIQTDNAIMMRLLDPQGHVLSETPASRNLLIPPQSITQTLQGQPWDGTINTVDGQEVQLYSQMLTVQGKPFAVLQVGQSFTSLHALLHQLIAILLIVGALALLICAICSYWLIDRAFAPIHQLIQTARRIKAGQLDQRVPLPRTRDEIQDLALTLNEMLDSLDQTVTQQRRFVADASHELRTPVAVIRNKTNVALLKVQTQHEYTTVLQEINAETEQLGHLINDLLALARGDEGHAPFEKEPVRLDVLAETTAASVQPLAEEHEIALTVHADGPVTLIGDEARLIQVVLNLLENALRYTPPGGHISLTVQKMQQSAQLVVRDTGVGIAPQHLPHIFERFYRADPARGYTGGSGLGLAIVEWIVRVHGGSIAVESQPTQGSCFTVTLPLHTRTETEAGPVSSCR